MIVHVVLRDKPSAVAWASRLSYPAVTSASPISLTLAAWRVFRSEIEVMGGDRRHVAGASCDCLPKACSYTPACDDIQRQIAVARPYDSQRFAIAFGGLAGISLAAILAERTSGLLLRCARRTPLIPGRKSSHSLKNL